MNKNFTKISLLCTFLFFTTLNAQQKISLPKARFSTGDDLAWKDKDFNDTPWKTIRTDQIWENQGVSGYNGYAWYRIHFDLPSSLLEKSYLKEQLHIYLSKIDDADETYLNGKLIGKTGSFPDSPSGYSSSYNSPREYFLSVKDPALRWDQENVLAIRVYDGNGNGGIYESVPYINILDLIDYITIKQTATKDGSTITVNNSSKLSIKGRLKIRALDTEQNDKVIKEIAETLTLPASGERSKSLILPRNKRILLQVSFAESHTGKSKELEVVAPYLLTPPPAATPKINGASVFGIRPNSPFLFRIAATGKKPLHYAVENLPQGLSMDENTGIIKGTLSGNGEYKMRFIVTNTLGEAQREFTVKVGDKLALTPPMGWNSWNCWGVSVTEEKVKSSAQALIDKGLIEHGWTYINIDDAWENANRSSSGEIVPNEKFPDMKGLGNWLHQQGLKFGIYSSPGPKTCGNYLGSYQHEAQDAATYAGWGIDYLKYDWCSYGEIFAVEKDNSISAYMRPYQLMEKALRAQKRDIVYSLCQYGMKDVWEWGAAVDGNCWRTTGDITDTWESLKSIGFSQGKLYPFAKPGRWNDPDMLIVGRVGWGDHLHPTRLTPDEQYTHISLWSLLSSPLLIGCDIAGMDDFTLNLLTNDEVIAVNQDPLGNQARQLLEKDSWQIWTKQLEDGSYAVGIFNLGDKTDSIEFNWSDLGLPAGHGVRDLWRQKELNTKSNLFSTKVAPHGVTLVKLEP